MRNNRDDKRKESMDESSQWLWSFVRLEFGDNVSNTETSYLISPPPSISLIFISPLPLGKGFA